MRCASSFGTSGVPSALRPPCAHVQLYTFYCTVKVEYFRNIGSVLFSYESTSRSTTYTYNVSCTRTWKNDVLHVYNVVVLSKVLSYESTFESTKIEYCTFEASNESTLYFFVRKYESTFVRKYLRRYFREYFRKYIHVPSKV